MSNAYYEVLKEFGDSGISFSYKTVPGGYHPLHWHEELELLYPLNGAADITINNKKYNLRNKQLLVVESCEVHSTYAYHSPCMFLCIHVSAKHMRHSMPDIDFRRIHCRPDEISDEDFAYYLEICKMLEHLTRLYMEDVDAFYLEAEGIILQVLAHLLRYFSTNAAPQLTDSDALSRQRIRQVIQYVEEHFREPLSLADVSGELGLSREYFCRFFKKNMGISFLQYLNEVRLTHAYYDLVNTDAAIMDIMEKNGLTNQKLFNQTFKKLYGDTPSAVRSKNK